VNAAGDALKADALDSTALAVINNWRSCHAYPLHAITMRLRERAPRVDGRAIVAQRLKRLASIRLKLERFDWLTLAQMQDMGGCRAVLRTVEQVEALDERYRAGTTVSQLIRRRDYIDEPKDDGYRGIHYVYRYRTRHPEYRDFEKLQIEVQLRSTLQHAWATTTETVSAFTGQRLKAGTGERPWKRFFVLVSYMMAKAEERPLVPGVPDDEDEVLEELESLAHMLEVRNLLKGWTTGMNLIETHPRLIRATLFLFALDVKAQTLQITPFSKAEEGRAADLYIQQETTLKDDPTKDVVLVSGSSLGSLRKAYPNYYADTRLFLDALTQYLD